MTKSCTTKDDDYPIVYRVLTIPGGCLGFCPSKVSLLSFLPGFWVSDISHDSDSFAMPLKTGLEKVKDRIESLAGRKKSPPFLDWRCIFVKWLEKLPASHVSFFGMLMFFFVVVVVVVVFALLVCRHPYCLGRFWAKSWAPIFSTTNLVVQTFDLSSHRDLLIPCSWRWFRSLKSCQRAQKNCRKTAGSVVVATIFCSSRK